MKTGIIDRIKSARSKDEVKKLLSELQRYSSASNKTIRRAHSWAETVLDNATD